MTDGQNKSVGRSRGEAADRDKRAQDDTAKTTTRPREIGGPSGPEPTRYGDWERKGICVDF